MDDVLGITNSNTYTRQLQLYTNRHQQNDPLATAKGETHQHIRLAPSHLIPTHSTALQPKRSQIQTTRTTPAAAQLTSPEIVPRTTGLKLVT